MGLRPTAGITSEEQKLRAQQMQELLAQRYAVQQAGEQPRAAQTGAVDGGSNVQPTFGQYTIPGVQGVPQHRAISRVTGETGMPGEVSEGTYQGKGFGMVRPEGVVSDSGVHHVNDTDYDPLYGHKKYTMWAVA